MFTHHTFKYDTPTPIHRRASVLLPKSPARNGKFIPRVKVAFFFFLVYFIFSKCRRFSVQQG